MSGEDDNSLVKFGPQDDENSILEEQNIEGDYRDFGGNSLDSGSYARNDLFGYSIQDGLLANESLSYLKKVRFIEQEFSASKLVSEVKYHH